MGPGVLIATAAWAAVTLGMPTVVADGAGPCPASQQVEAALAEQLDRHQAGGWTVHYAPAGRDVIDVVVRDPSGNLRARRRVAAGSPSCTIAARTVAAIVARAVAPLAWDAPTSDIAAAADEGEAAPPGDSRTLGQPPRLAVAIGPAIISAPSPQANVIIDAGLRVTDRWSLRLGVVPLPARHTETVGRAGSARLFEVGAFVAPTLNARLFGLLVEAGPTLAVALHNARTEGISQPSAGRRGILRAGVLLGAATTMGPRWRIGILAAVLGQIAGPEFAVVTDAGEQVALRAPGIAGLAGLRIERVLLP
jgi:hypothetical protein